MRSISTMWTLLMSAVASTVVASIGAADPVAFTNPPEIASENGILSATLTVGPAKLAVAGENVTFPALYDGLYTPPVLRVQPGDTIRLLLKNFAQLPINLVPTNLHYHGLNVSSSPAPRTRTYSISTASRTNPTA
jgi:FtsP/CotA-like multicopper oxidase with cupredoxin domain